MTDETKAKVAKLPAWARDLIRQLESRVGSLPDELAQLRRKITELEKANRLKQDRVDAMVEMFQCAAKGGNEVAAAVMRIAGDYLTDPDESAPIVHSPAVVTDHTVDPGR